MQFYVVTLLFILLHMLPIYILTASIHGAAFKQPTCSPSSPTCNVIKCESKRCMTCKNLVLGNSFSSNLTNKNEKH